MVQSISLIVVAATIMLAALPARGEGPIVEPRGELLHRINMVQNRMLFGENPRFTDDFIVADVALRPDYPRRFSNYSGDLSGRFLGAYACMPVTNMDLRMKALVSEILSCQKEDGRFGSMELAFTPEAIGLDHTALLWGNGRLLVGLLEYHALAPDAHVLEASRRLGDFVIKASQGCMDSTVVERVNNLGAAGMICVSQLVEPLVLLASATGDSTYLEDGKAVLPWLQQARGTQHTHGYLTTLRGIMQLYDVTKDTQYLDLVTRLYTDLVTSPDYLIYGGVREYFGDKYDRDEGCSEADFIRLSLHLWRETGEASYLERAERCLLNQFYNDQFATGDFGHHPYFSQGRAPSLGQGRAWWCCTMHGLRAFRDVIDAIVTAQDDALALNLFLDAQWSDASRAVRVETNARDDGGAFCTLTVDRGPTSGMKLKIRKPSWTNTVRLTINGENTTTQEQNGYVLPEGAPHQGDVVGIFFDLATRLVRRDGTTFELDALTNTPVEAALFRGPWLLGVNEADDPLFYGEPWHDNVILLPAAVRGQSSSAAPLTLPIARVNCAYIHGGYPDRQRVILQPLSEGTRHEPSTFAVWLKYRAADE